MPQSRVAFVGLHTRKWWQARAVCLALAALSLSPAPLRGQPRGVEAFFYSDTTRVPLDIAPGQLGVMAREGVTRATIERQLRLKVLREYPERIFILSLEKPLSRAELVLRARQIKASNPEIVAQAGFVATPGRAAAPFIVTDELVVRFKRDPTKQELEDFLREERTQVLMRNPFSPGEYLLTVTSASRGDALETANRYHGHARVAYAHPNFVRVIIYRQFVPNDPLFPNQWHHQNTGQGGGTPDADLDTPLAWTLTQGGAGTVIAVIDGGFNVTHPDLVPSLWTNPGEVAGNGIDDDGNSLIDDVQGWDFTNCTAGSGAGCGDANPTGGNHGTAVAGLAAARGNNSLGVAGTCLACGLMLIRTGGTVFSDALSFGYAQQEGAQVITNSWGYAIGTPTTATVVTAINNAATGGRGGLGSVVLFAMNNPNVNDCTGTSPDISSIPNVIAVSRATNQDQFNGGGFGNCMDVLGPTHGGTLWVTTTDVTGSSGYNNTTVSPSCPSTEAGPPPTNARDYTACFNGTSAATPQVAGVAGLILTANPNLTRTQVQQLLQDTADKVEDSQGTYADGTGFSTPATGNATHGWGRVNAFEAVRVAAPVGLGGRAGVDVFIRDNRLDWGNTEQPSSTVFETSRGFIPHWQSVDIKVDAPPYQTAPTTSASFDAVLDENAESGDVNKVYVRVRNRGPVASSTVTTKLHWAFAGAGLPAFPADFWTAFPGDASNTTQWHPLGSVSLTNLGYSGGSVATTVNDNAQIATFDFTAPPIDPTQPNPDHFCLLAVLDAADDRAAALSRPTTPSDFVPDLVTPTDNNVTHRNITVVDARGRSERFQFFVRNPTAARARSVLDATAPRGWKLSVDRLALGKPFQLEPGEERLVALTVIKPKRGATGTVTVIQRLQQGHQSVTGGLTYRFRAMKGGTPK